MRRALPIVVSTFLAAGLLGLGYAQWSPDHGRQAPSVGAVKLAAALATGSERAVHEVASLADKGDLLGYSGTPASRSASAPNWYRADISEQHAFRSLVTGNMAVTAPDGTRVRLGYQRHVEHPNGNWTWIGRNADGQEAIITFGEKAVFGSIPNGDTELRLTTMGGRGWLVQVDPRKEREPEPRKPDYLVPPELAAALASPEPAAAAAEPQAAAAAATTTVDVALGYTTGFASELGGDSQAVTRLQHLVDVTNQAYANSQIDAQIRLVKTVSVAFADATNNDDALTKLTGYKSGTGSVPVDPAFAQLRAARDQYGADLVSLVRRFRTPENAGCGLAWLIGGNQSTINNSDAPFGYSVVSDDIDRGDVNESDGKTYACRKESLAHELGHNMGQNHNVEDSDGDSGAHPYSYGYRESSSTGFYTVMAYRLGNSSQRGVRYFANPNVMESVSGRPAGIANSSDNARSMNITMPIVANFRALVVPIEVAGRKSLLHTGDVDGDGRSDLLFEHPGEGRFEYRRMSGATTLQTVVLPVTPGYWIAAVGDFDADGRSDVVWTSVGRDMWLWRSQGNGQFTVSYAGSYDVGWQLVGAGDFNGDLTSDLLLHHNGAGQVAYQTFQNGMHVETKIFNVTPGYRVATIANYSAAAGDEILWTSSANDLWMWTWSGAGVTSTFGGTYGQGWYIAGSRDINGDGIADLVLHDPHHGRAAYSLRSGAVTTLYVEFEISMGYGLNAIGDFNADGRADIVWSSAGNDMWMWVGNGTWFGAQYAGLINPGSRLVGAW